MPPDIASDGQGRMQGFVAALLRHEGPKGELLSAVLAYERGEFPSPPAAATGTVSLAGAYRAALEWADEAGRAIA